MLEAIVAILVVLVAYVGWLAIDIVRASKEYDQTRERLIEKFGLQEPLAFEPPVGYDQAKQDRFNGLAPLFLNLPSKIQTQPDECLEALDASRLKSLLSAAHEIADRQAINFSPDPKRLVSVTATIRSLRVLLFEFSKGGTDSSRCLTLAAQYLDADRSPPLLIYQLQKYSQVQVLCKTLNQKLLSCPSEASLRELEEVIHKIQPRDQWSQWLIAEAHYSLTLEPDLRSKQWKQNLKVSSTGSLYSLLFQIPFFTSETAMRAYNALQFSEYGLVFARFQNQTVTLKSFDEYRILTSQRQYRGRAVLENALSKRGETSLYIFSLALAEFEIAKKLVEIWRGYQTSHSVPNSFNEPDGVRFERTKSGFEISCEGVRYAVKV